MKTLVPEKSHSKCGKLVGNTKMREANSQAMYPKKSRSKEGNYITNSQRTNVYEATMVNMMMTYNVVFLVHVIGNIKRRVLLCS